MICKQFARYVIEWKEKCKIELKYILEGEGRNGKQQRRRVVNEIPDRRFGASVEGSGAQKVARTQCLLALSRDWSPFQGLWGAMEGTVWTTTSHHTTRIARSTPVRQRFFPVARPDFTGYPGFPPRFSLVSRLVRRGRWRGDPSERSARLVEIRNIDLRKLSLLRPIIFSSLSLSLFLSPSRRSSFGEVVHRMEYRIIFVRKNYFWNVVTVVEKKWL